MDVLVAAVHQHGWGGPRGGWDGSVIYCYYCKGLGHTKQCPFRTEISERCTYLCDSSRWQAVVISIWAISDVPVAVEHTVSVFIFLCHFHSYRYSYLLLSLSMSHTWVINSRASDHMTGNRSIMYSFTHASYSNSVVLADGSHQQLGLWKAIGTDMSGMDCVS